MTEPHDQAGTGAPPGQVEATTGVGMTRRRFGRMALVVLGMAGAGGATLVAGCSSGDDDTASDGLASDDGSGESAEGGGSEWVMYSSPGCGCCGGYADYLGSHGYTIDTRQTDDLDSVKSRAGVPDDASGCHTTLAGDYVIDGHVPVEAIDRLLRDRPAVDGIALPGMPAGSPGMGGEQDGAFEILSFKDGRARPYMTV